MKALLPVALAAALVSACSKPPAQPPAQLPGAAAETPAAPVAALGSGIETANGDPAVRAQDDFYRHVNGSWLAKTEIPADKSSYGSGSQVFDETEKQLRGIVESAGKDASSSDADSQKIGALFASFMDEARIDEAGLTPLAEDFAAIDAMKDKKEIAGLMATWLKKLPQPGTFGPSGTSMPFVIYVHLDNKDSTRYVIDLQQSGIGLPDRDYYLKDDDTKLKGFRAEYVKYVEKMLGMAGDKNAARSAKDILVLETGLAKVQWTKVEQRDPIKGYNKIEIAKLDNLAPGFDWAGWLKAADLDGKVTDLIVGQPSYLTGFAKLLASTPLPVWKTYFKWHLLNERAASLSKPFVEARFAFYGTVLRGVPEDRPRWKRGISSVESNIGEALGKVYVAQYFPPAYKARVETLVKNLLATFKTGIDALDWMGPETKKEAQAKLAKINYKIGYPDAWRDYSKLELKADDLMGNLVRSAQFEYARNVAKLGHPVDHGEWGMTPQTINAYYDPEKNEIVFPAAILQPPYFDVKAEDAVNYGSIGAVIGHEISHGFDDQGAQYDGDGNLRQWFSETDLKNFKAKTAALVAQYNGYEPVKGYHLNGALTLGENIADNSGLAIAYKAYHLSQDGKPGPVIDGLTADQRFYLGFGQVWRAKMRDNAAIERIKTDPHSLPEFRVTGTVVNQPAFYTTFEIKEGDKMFLPPEQRVSIW